MIQLPQSVAELCGGQKACFKGLGQFIQIHHLSASVGIHDHIGQQICGDQRMRLFVMGILYYIAVPVQQRIIPTDALRWWI